MKKENSEVSRVTDWQNNHKEKLCDEGIGSKKYHRILLKLLKMEKCPSKDASKVGIGI